MIVIPTTDEGFTPACAMDPETWFPTKGGSPATAKRFCVSCPARQKCLEIALDQEDDQHRSTRHGI